MNLASLIGLRYYRTRSSRGFVSLVTLVSFLGMVLGVVALVVVVSVMNGFDRELKARILGAVPHVLVKNADPQQLNEHLADFPVAAVTRFQESEILLLTPGGSHLVNIHGIDPETEQGASSIPDAMVEGSLQSLQGTELELVVGRSIAQRFGLANGDTINAVLPVISPGGKSLRPHLFPVRIVGSFSVGSELDSRLAVMHIEDLLQVTGGEELVRITLNDIFAAPVVVRHLANAGFDSESWTNQFGDFFRTVRMEKIMMFVLLSFVVAIASFSIVSGLTMLVATKRRDIAVLRTMGMPRSGIFGIFMVQGLGIGVVGVCAGLIVGIPAAHLAPEIMGAVEALFGFSIVAGTYFSEIPTDVRWPDVVAIGLVTFLISVTATLYPAWRAASLLPAQVLRYE